MQSPCLYGGGAVVEPEATGCGGPSLSLIGAVPRHFLTQAIERMFPSRGLIESMMTAAPSRHRASDANSCWMVSA